MANFDLYPDASALLKAYYEAKKSQFNKNTDIKIKGVEIELYVQDVQTTTASNGIYSVCDDKWVKEPKPIKTITKYDTEHEVSK